MLFQKTLRLTTLPATRKLQKPVRPAKRLPKVLWCVVNQPIVAAIALLCPFVTLAAQAAPGSLIRVGLRTQGGPIAIYSRSPLTLRDSSGKKLSVAAGEAISFVAITNPLALCKVNSITVRTARGSFPNWRQITVRGQNAVIAVSSFVMLTL
jgi:hypothetical protein